MFGYGLGILLIIIGAVLRFAVNDRVQDVDLPMIGTILIVAGLASLLLSAIFNYMHTHRRDRAVVDSHEIREDRPIQG